METIDFPISLKITCKGTFCYFSKFSLLLIRLLFLDCYYIFCLIWGISDVPTRFLSPKSTYILSCWWKNKKVSFMLKTTPHLSPIQSRAQTQVSWFMRSYKRCLLLGRKVMANLDSIFRSRDITLPTKVHLVKATVFPVVMYGYESWTVKKAEHWRIDAFELWC